MVRLDRETGYAELNPVDAEGKFTAGVPEFVHGRFVKDADPLGPNFFVIRDTAINAFALPGGYIYITRGLLAHLDSEAELAALLGHEMGHGPIGWGQTVVFDLWPRDEASACFADMTRTVVKGKASPAVKGMYAAVKEAQEEVFSLLRHGADGLALVDADRLVGEVGAGHHQSQEIIFK